MVNFQLNPVSLLGIALALAGTGLYFLRSIRPELTRDYDIFFAAVGLLCGLILFTNGWRQDPILQFSQFLLAGSTVFFALESIRLRGVATEQAKRSAPIVDDERPVSRVYRAELDELDMVETRPTTRRIRGSRDSTRSSRDEYGEEGRRRSSKSSERSRPAGRLQPGDYPDEGSAAQRPRKRRPRPDTSVDDVAVVDPDFSDEQDSPRTSEAPAVRPRRRDASSITGRAGRRPSEGGETRRRRRDTTDADYADYQPVNYSEDEEDNSSNF